jgi:hypothetical protein
MSAPEEKIKPISFNAEDAAIYSGISAGVLGLMRHEKRGPAYVQIPGTGSIRYLKSDLDVFLASGRIDPELGPTPEQAKFRRKGGPGRPKRAAKLRNRSRKQRAA